MSKPYIVFCLAGRRGYEFLSHFMDKYIDIYNCAVFTCPESDDKEPRFTNDIEKLCKCCGVYCKVLRRIQEDEWFWDYVKVDLLFAVGWRYLIPKEIYTKAAGGAFVFHDSLLPRYRGFAPTVRAMINGDMIGASLIKMEESVDSGDIIDQRTVDYSWVDTIKQVMPKITSVYLEMFDKNITKIVDGTYKSSPQVDCPVGHLVTYSPKMMPEDYKIDWNKSTTEVLRLIKAVTNPYPGAYTFMDGNEVRIWKAIDRGPKYVVQIPGRIVEKTEFGYVVMTGDGVIEICSYSIPFNPELELKVNRTLK